MPSPLLQVRNLTVEFPRPGGVYATAVSDVGLEITAGEVLGIVGESGSGKSVTSLALMQLLPTQARVNGIILFEDDGATYDLLRLSENDMRKLRGTKLAMIFQEPMTALNPVMRVGDQIAEALCAHEKISRASAWDRAVQAMNDVAIADSARRARDYPHQLSGGMRQRIMIAMAIINRPRLLIADEPTTALDVTVQAQILELLAGLRERFGLAMLFISHDLAVVSQVADRVAVMHGGKVLEIGTKNDIFRSPAHPYTQGLLKAVPSLKSDRNAELATVPTSQSEDGAASLREVAAGHWVRSAVREGA